jgi:hypothetical protein
LFFGRALVQHVIAKHETIVKLGQAIRYKSSPSSAIASLGCGLFATILHATPALNTICFAKKRTEPFIVSKRNVFLQVNILKPSFLSLRIKTFQIEKESSKIYQHHRNFYPSDRLFYKKKYIYFKKMERFDHS